MTDEPYQYFMQPEPRINLGPILTEHDPLLNKSVRFRYAKIGMVRNASEQSRKRVKVYIDPYPHVRIEKAKDLQGWYKGKNEPNQVRPRPCYTEALLTEPYGGYCPVGCIHCYINSGMRGYRGTGLVTVPIHYGAQIAKQLATLLVGSAGYLTSFHDPFNSLETAYHNSQEAAQEFVNVGLPIFFLSRLKYPQWAINLLKQNKYSYAQKSINTPDSKDWKRMSPGALSLDEQLADVAKLNKQGIYVSIQLNPVIPGVTSNKQIIALLQLLAGAGADHVIVKFVEAGYSWAPTMVNRMVKTFGDRGKEFAKLFTQNIGGQKTVDETYRLHAHDLYQREAKRLGLTYSTCYEYRYEKVGGCKTGISIGPEVTSSAQCHGKRVPVHYRLSTDAKFQPFRKCPPTGCLYCADEDGNTPCNNVLLGEAPALRLSDLRKPFVQ